MHNNGHFFIQKWGTGVTGLMRGLVTLQSNQEPVMVKKQGF